MPGGGANVARNVQALGAKASLCGIIGKDINGMELIDILQQEGVQINGVFRTPGVQTTVKTRILAARQQVVRVDWDGKIEVPESVTEKWYKHIEKAIRRADGVIIEDYNKGLINQPLMDVIMAAVKKAGVPCGFDPKQNIDLTIKGITVATPNRREAFSLAGLPETPPVNDPLKDLELQKVACILRDKWDARFMVITLGAQGMLLLTEKGDMHHIPTQAREVFDVSGAGDTVIAAMMLALAAGANSDQASELANCAAGVVVGKVGTASCTKGELLDFLETLMESGVESGI